jgi:photosystem II stability/assembly factor-like uncharacterized protein
MISSNEGYAVAQQITMPSSSSIIRWDGTSWKTMTTPLGYFNDIDMLSSIEGWAVGKGGAIIRWDGISWTRQDPISDSWGLPTGLVFETNLTEPLESIDMLSSTDGWAVGRRGSIVHWNGACWSLVDCPPTFEYRTMWSISMVSSSDGWAVGDGGAIIRWDGSTWENVTSPVPANKHLFSVDMVSSDDGWAVGSDGVIIHWDGNKWSNIESPTGAWLHCVKMVTSTEGWILGVDGVYHLKLEEEEASDVPIEYFLTVAAVMTIVVVWIVIKKRTSKSTEKLWFL